MTLAALDWTLRTLLDGSAIERIPVLRILLAPQAEILERAEQLAAALERRGGSGVSVVTETSVVGGGSLPDFELPGAVVRLEPKGSAAELATRLRSQDPPVLVRVQRDAVLLDPRTLDASEIEELARVLTRLVDSTA